MRANSSKVRFPIWQFLNQSVFERDRPIILNPRRFWYMYRIALLERCLLKKSESTGSRDSGSYDSNS